MNNDSREANAIRNVFIGSFNQIVHLVLSFVAKTVFISILGVAFLGLNGLFTNLFVLFSSIETGIGIAMMYSLYQPFAGNNEDRIAVLYKFYRNIYRNTAIGIAIAGAALFPFLNSFIKTDLPIANVEMYYMLFLINTIIYNMFIYNEYIIIANQKKYLVSYYNMVFGGITFLLQILILLYFQSYQIYLVLIILKTIFYCGALHFKVHKMYPYIIRNKKKLSKVSKKPLVKNAFDMSVYRVSQMMISGTDNIIISVLLGTIYVGYYSNYEFIIQGVGSMTVLIFESLAASVGNLFVEKDLDKNYQTFHMIENLNLWLAGFTATAIFTLSQSFITAWIGESYLLSQEILFFIVLNFYLVVSRDANKMFRESAGLFDRMKKVVLLNAFLNIVLSVLLGLRFGMVGIFAATVISGLLTSYPYEPYLIHKYYLKKSIKPYLLMQIKGGILVLLSVLITQFFIGFVYGTGWGSFILKMIICGIVANLFYFIMLNKTDGVQCIIRTVKNIL